ncbi:hypothetical protein DIE23_27460 [Burkholderia sp. Bp9143]|uniref:hypothetical protein n=1 Tax=Burkholderia sp. Bp9143 TaxID=2184574 RepID=UPI000F5ABA20|nr:hypothetical protein [Burkholderia sp. Bp9143]RQR27224.1 hypothetical protein DIE23_27460 [Burkholderia sp. Bp9143]
MKALLRLLAAIVLTIPVYLGLANSPPDDWFQSGAGWRAFEPLFNVFERLGGHGQGDILISTMLGVSFVIALALVWLGARMFDRRT